jgi:ankyrin repeat protein
MKSFLHFQILYCPKESSAIDDLNFTENPNHENIDSEDKSKKQKLLYYSFDDIANLLTSSDRKEIIHGIDLFTSLIPLNELDYSHLNIICSLNHLRQKLAKIKKTSSASLDEDYTFQFAELSDILTSIIENSSMEKNDKEDVFMKITVFFFNIFDTLNNFYDIKNSRLCNIVDSDSSSQDPIKKLMNFHLKLFKLSEEIPASIPDLTRLINENIELFFNNLPSDCFAFKLIFDSNCPEIIHEFFKTFNEKKIENDQVKLSQFFAMALCDLNQEAIEFIEREFLYKIKSNSPEIRLEINKCITAQLILRLELQMLDVKEIQKLLSLSSCLINDESMSKNIFHELAKVKNEEICNLFFLNLQYSHDIEQEFLAKSFDVCDDQGRTPLFVAFEHENMNFIKLLIENGFNCNAYIKIDPDKYSFLLSYFDCSHLSIKSCSINVLGLAIEENKFEILNELLSFNDINLRLPCIKFELVDEDKKIIEKKILSLEYAIILDKEYAVGLLISYKIKMILTQEQQSRCLYFSILSENSKIFSILSFNHFDVTLPIDNKGLSAFDYAIIYNSSEIIRNCKILKITSLLQEKQYKLENDKVVFMQPLQFAVSFANYEAIDALLFLGSNINHKTSSQISAMSLAISKNDKALIQFLITRSAKIGHLEIQEICVDANLNRDQTQEIRDFISICTIEILKKQHALKLQTFQQRRALPLVALHVSFSYFTKYKYNFYKFINEFSPEMLKIFKSQNALIYFQNLEDNLIDFFLNLKIIKDKNCQPKQVAIEVLKQKTHVSFFCILTCLKSDINQSEINPTLNSILALNELYLMMLSTEIAKIITLEKMPNFEHKLAFSFNPNAITKSQDEINKDLDLYYQQKLGEALNLFKEIIKINNSEFLSVPFYSELPIALNSKENVLSFIDSLKITVEMSRKNYTIKSLIQMIDDFLPIILKFQENQVVKEGMKSDPIILKKISEIASCIIEQSRSNSYSQEMMLSSTDNYKETSARRAINASHFEENPAKPNPQISIKKLRKDKIKNALASLSRKKQR